MTNPTPHGQVPNKYLTVVYRDIAPGKEARELIEHPKMSASSWSHALNDRDAAIAQVSTLRTAHVQNPTEIEHDAGDVSKNGAGLNMSTQHARIAELEAQIEALSEVQALSAAPAVPAGWKAVPVNPTPEMWKAAKSVPRQNPYGLVWDAMLAASPTPPAAQPATTKADATTGAALGVEPGAVYAELPDEHWLSTNIISVWNEDSMRDFADRTHALRMQAAPKTAPGELSADSLRHQNKLLAETLGACILASGIVRKDIDGFTGPELLHFGEDLRSMLEAAPQPAPAEQEEAAQRLRKTLDSDPGDVNGPLHPRYIAGFKSGHAAGRRRAADEKGQLK